MVGPTDNLRVTAQKLNEVSVLAFTVEEIEKMTVLEPFGGRMGCNRLSV